MPIKFRCQHCRQFLGISRSKAGQVVDCPTCGRTLRVPNLDGSVQPLPEPKLNVAELAGALDELARIGREADVGDEAGAESHDADAVRPQPVAVKELPPLPRPEPIPLEPAAPAEPVDIHRPKPVEEGLASLAASASAESDPKNSRGKTSAAGSARPMEFPAVLKSLPVLAALLCTAVVAFGGGWLVGGVGGDEPQQSGAAAENGKSVSPPKPAARRPVYHPDDWKTAVTGQINYLYDGRSRPDKGARVIVLPEHRRGGQSKVPVAGFWPQTDDSDDADFRVSLAALRELGGNAALVDEKGRFEIKLPPSAGKYHIIAISANKSDTLETPVDDATIALLGQYFDRPHGLIRKLAFKRSYLSFAGGGTQTWNHTFDD